MKKITFVLALTLIFGITYNSNAQEDRKLTNGFSLNFVTGFPSSSYGAEIDAGSDMKYGTMYGLQLGNRWYFNPGDKAGFGLMANWVDFSVAVKSGTNFSRATLDFSFLELGPVGTIVLTDDIAIDGYYNLRPTIISSAAVAKLPAGDETIGHVGFGVSHAIGAAFRWKALNIGVEYVVGGINSKGVYSGSNNLTIGDAKIKTNSLRIMLGVKF